jgi:hypothetical protein
VPVGTGPTFGVGVGVRFLFLTAGVRVRDALFSSLHYGGGDQPGSFNLWELNAEAALHMRIRDIDPYCGVRGGYAFVGSFSDNYVPHVPPDVSVNGFNVGPIVGIDLYLSHLVSIGAEGDVEFLFLNRSQAQGAGEERYSNPFYERSASSVGLGAGATAHLGIHF